jgi:hypothetical protein
MKKKELDKLNTNPMRHIVKDYCLKYPIDLGDQKIHDSDVIRPKNHLWADSDEIASWKMYDSKSTVYFPTYGLCGICWASGPAYKTCSECKLGKYQIVQYDKYSQTIAKKLGKHHETAKANRKQNWLRTCEAHFDMQIHCIKIEAKHKMWKKGREHSLKTIPTSWKTMS